MYFYLPVAGGIQAPEGGLGGHVYTADLGNLYDPDGSVTGSGNALESAILDAGYNGYVNREQGTAVVLNNDVPVKYAGPASEQKKVKRSNERIVHKIATRREGDELVRRIANEEMVGVVKARPALTKSAPSFKMQFGEARVLATEAPAANATLSEAGSALQFSEDAPQDVSPIGFFSELSRRVQAGPGKAMPDQWKAYINGLTTKGVKAEEIQWSGVLDWLGTQTGKVSKEDLSAFLNANGVKVTETALGAKSASQHKEFGNVLDAQDFIAEFHDQTRAEMIEDYGFENPRDYINAANQMFNDQFPDSREDLTKYGEYTLPGGTNYREVLLTLPEVDTLLANELPGATKRLEALEELIAEFDKEGNSKRADEFRAKAVEQRARVAALSAKPKPRMSGNYKSGHFEQPNILAHIRMNDRVDADGKRVLLVEEIQSDFGQDFKKQRDAIAKAVDSDFLGIVERMKKAGVLEVVCD